MELVLTCLCFNMGTLCVIYLWESHVSGQQGEKLPAYLRPSCWVLITVFLVAARQKGLAPVLYQQKELAGKVGRKQVKAERSMQRGRNSGWNGESVSTEGSSTTMLQGSWKWVLTLLWVLLHLLRKNPDSEVLLDCRDMGETPQLKGHIFKSF